MTSLQGLDPDSSKCASQKIDIECPIRYAVAGSCVPSDVAVVELPDNQEALLSWIENRFDSAMPLIPTQSELRIGAIGSNRKLESIEIYPFSRSASQPQLIANKSSIWVTYWSANQTWIQQVRPVVGAYLTKVGGANEVFGSEPTCFFDSVMCHLSRSTMAKAAFEIKRYRFDADRIVSLQSWFLEFSENNSQPLDLVADSSDGTLYVSVVLESQGGESRVFKISNSDRGTFCASVLDVKMRNTAIRIQRSIAPHYFAISGGIRFAVQNGKVVCLGISTDSNDTSESLTLTCADPSLLARERTVLIDSGELNSHCLFGVGISPSGLVHLTWMKLLSDGKWSPWIAVVDPTTGVTLAKTAIGGSVGLGDWCGYRRSLATCRGGSIVSWTGVDASGPGLWVGRVLDSPP